MRKLPRHQLEEEPLRRKRKHWIRVIVLGLFLAPIVFEGSALCAAQWQSMFGPVTIAETPILDQLGPYIGSASSSIRNSTLAVFRNLPWRASFVIPVVFAWAFCGCLLLRRR
jgi:hypothetical protein